MSYFGLRLIRSALWSLPLLALSVPAAAMVTEPNGTVVPATVNNGETTLQAFFNTQRENINAVADASTSPSTFQPLCDFQATLVLSESGNSQTGLAWYNVPPTSTDPNHTATPVVYMIGTPPLMLNFTVSSSDIATDTNYAPGGEVGFALMENLGNGYVPVYYSENTRNAYCSECTGAGETPGYWTLALAYQSTVTANSYYLAWEDWAGANSTSWPDDGDFNDKVYQFTGVVCEGGGVPCDTGLQGVCSLGVTQCEVGGTLTCKPLKTASAEKCDNLDNDCNGIIDDGPGLCPGDEVCVQGNCVDPCGSGEFVCVGWTCQDGLCVDPKCVGVSCAAGQICQAGTCVGGCDGVTCPLGQVCELGVCLDPCAGVSCPGAVCLQGACVTSCECQACPSGQVCATSGSCVDTGCDTLTCAAGQVCRAGACIDACTGAVCPGGAGCENGQCDPPPTGMPGAGGTSGASTTGAGGSTVSGAGGASATGAGNASGQAGSTGAGGKAGASGIGGTAGTTTGPHEAGGVVGCSCEAAGFSGRRGLGMALVLAAGLLLGRRKRRARR